METRPRICASITSGDTDIIKEAEPLVDLYELRLDLIGNGWEKLVKNLGKPWIACNRAKKEGGRWRGSEAVRIAELIKAVELGAAIVDIELGTPDINKVVGQIKNKAKCLISCHDLKGTPPIEKMREIIKNQLEAGADICKLVTSVRAFADNLTVLQLIRDFPQTRLVAFCMGEPGIISRILCPLVGGDFTYASLKEGAEAAPGQLKARELRSIYEMLKHGG